MNSEYGSLSLLFIHVTYNSVYPLVSNSEFIPLPSQRLLFLLLFSHSLVSDSLRPRGLQHDRLPCPSQCPGVCLNTCPLSGLCHSTLSSSVIPFSSCLLSSQASGSFPMSWLFASGGQTTGASASVLPSVLSMNIHVDFL